MTTISNKSLFEFSDQLFEIDITDIEQKQNAIILRIAKIIAAPIIVLRNIKMLVKTKRAKKQIQAIIKKAIKEFNNASENEKVIFYADFNRLTESINNVTENNHFEGQTGGLLTKIIVSNFLSLQKHVNHYGQYFYKLTYPENKDINDKQYIEDIIKAHNNSNLQHC